MPENTDILFGQDVVANLQDEDGYVDLTGATVTFQYRVECGRITDLVGTVLDAATGRVSVSAVPVGSYKVRWKAVIGGATSYYPDYDWDELTVRAIDGCSTFGLFVSAITKTIFPEGEAENLVANHRKYVTDALIDLQQKIPCLRTEHRDRISMADTYTDCDASVYGAPRGFIAEVYAVLQGGCCEKRYFQPVDWDEMEQMLKDSQNCGRIVNPSGYYSYEYYGDYGYDYAYADYPGYNCLHYADSSGATDARFRPSQSFSAIKDGMLYLFPALQSNEVLVIEWDGIKRSWKDTDEVVFDREVHDATEHFLNRKSAGREDCDIQKVQLAQSDYDTLVAKLIWQCKKERRIERRVHYFSNCHDFCNARTRPRTAGFSAETGTGGGGDGGAGGGAISLMGDCAVDNYTALRELSTADCQSVKVLGYASAFDGGGGIFIREVNTPSQTDNDGDIVVSTFNSAYYWRKWL